MYFVCASLFTLALARVYKIDPPVCALDLPTKSHHTVIFAAAPLATMSLTFSVKRPNRIM